MIKKIIIPILCLLIALLLVCGIIIFSKKEEIVDENILYSIKFNNVSLRVMRYDYSLGQNQIVGVEKSIDNGEYEKITIEPITVSMKPMFVFLNENLGFSISKSDLTKSNNYMGMKVTYDGGKTFMSVVINYDNPNIEILTINDVPYYENNILKLPCSIYQVKDDKSGYENVELIFVSTDNGLTWNI